MDHRDRQDRNPAMAELLDDAYAASVDVETAARHLWMIHKEADRLQAERAAAGEDAAPPTVVVLPDAVHAGGPIPQSLSMTRRIPRAAVPLLVVLMLMSSSGMALAASRTSLPGDVLYPIKRGTEHAQLIFARHPEARAQLQLAFAHTRLEEIRRIGSTRPQLVPALVTDLAASLSAAEASAPESVAETQRLREQTTQEIASLSLEGSVEQAVGEVLTASAPIAVAEATATAVEEPTELAATQSDTATAVAAAEPTSTALITAPPVTTGEAVTATPTPVTSAPASPTTTGTPSATEGSGGSGTATTTSSPSESGSESASPEPTPTDGQVVSTPRPHPSGEGGVSRTEDEPSEAPESEPAEQPATEGGSAQEGAADEGAGDAGATSTPSETWMPYTRQHD